MADIEAIKARVRKLMAYSTELAGDINPAEIENAMRHAAALIDKHHLDVTEFTEQEQKDSEQNMGQSYGKTESSKFHRWETLLAAAMEELFGCIKHYYDGGTEPYRINGVIQMHTGRYSHQAKRVRRVAFYGPVVECDEAASLFTEWCHLIATMGIMRWGGAYRGDGEAYCEGFALELFRKAAMMNTNRKRIEAKAPKLLEGESAPTTAITLAVRYEILQKRAEVWLKEDQKVKLRKGSGQQGANNYSDAYQEGREHGKAAGFGRQSKAKQLTHQG